MKPVDSYGFDDQAAIVLDYWYKNKRTGKETTVNFNFMARGEPLENPDIQRRFGQIHTFLWEQATISGLSPVYNISTILPKNAPDLRRYVLKDTKIYWSLYSPLEKFRKRWLPKALEPIQAARKINAFREQGGKVVLHNAFIKGENDTNEQFQALLDFLYEYDLTDLDYNIVRYNPYDQRYGEESENIDWIHSVLSGVMKGKVQLIERVGRDVNASCGTFHSGA